MDIYVYIDIDTSIDIGMHVDMGMDIGTYIDMDMDILSEPTRDLCFCWLPYRWSL